MAVLASKMKDGGKWKAFVEGNSDFVECVVRVTHHPFQKRNTQQIRYFFQKSLRISFYKSHESLELAINVVGEQVLDVVLVVGKPRG